MSSFSSKIGALLSRRAFGNFKKKLDYTEYGGALMLGVRAGVVKAHGSSNAKAVKNAVLQARDFAKGKVVERIGEVISTLSDAQGEE